MEIMRRLFTEEEGQGLVEYVMIVAVVVAMGILVKKSKFGDTISTALSGLITEATKTTTPQ